MMSDSKVGPTDLRNKVKTLQLECEEKALNANGMLQKSAASAYESVAWVLYDMLAAQPSEPPTDLQKAIQDRDQQWCIEAAKHRFAARAVYQGKVEMTPEDIPMDLRERVKALRDGAAKSKFDLHDRHLPNEAAIWYARENAFNDVLALLAAQPSEPPIATVKFKDGSKATLNWTVTPAQPSEPVDTTPTCTADALKTKWQYFDAPATPAFEVWEVVPGRESDSWGIRKKGEPQGMSIAQMMWEKDAREVVTTHNAGAAASPTTPAPAFDALIEQLRDAVYHYEEVTAGGVHRCDFGLDSSMAKEALEAFAAGAVASPSREELEKLVEQLCDCEGKRLNGRARELANEIRALLSRGTPEGKK